MAHALQQTIMRILNADGCGESTTNQYARVPETGEMSGNPCSAGSVCARITGCVPRPVAHWFHHAPAPRVPPRTVRPARRSNRASRIHRPPASLTPDSTTSSGSGMTSLSSVTPTRLPPSERAWLRPARRAPETARRSRAHPRFSVTSPMLADTEPGFPATVNSLAVTRSRKRSHNTRAWVRSACGTSTANSARPHAPPRLAPAPWPSYLRHRTSI